MERVDLEQWKGREVARLLALVETERRYYQEIVASLPVGLLVLSNDLTIVSSNRAVRRILGIRAGDPVRGRLDTLLPQFIFEKAQQVIAAGAAQNNLLIEHEGRQLRISILPIRNWDDENQQEALVSIEDISDIIASGKVAAAPLPETAPAETPAPPEPPAPEVPPAEPAAAEHKPQPAGKRAEEEEEPYDELPEPEIAAEESLELLQSVNAIVWAADVSDMNFLFVTHASESMLGISSDHWLNTPNFFSERIYPADREAIVHSYREAIREGRPHSCEFRAQTADGRIVWLRETSRILEAEDGKPRHLIGLTIDITEKRRLEDEYVQAQRVDAIGKLSARLSHDLNNLLMIVNGYSEELLAHVGQTDPLRADLQEILTATARVGVLTNHLLAFTRRQAAAAAIVDVSQMLGKMESQLRQAAGPDVTLSVEAEPGIQARADEAQLQEIVASLVARARGGMPQGGTITVSISEKHVTEDIRRPGAPLKPALYAVISIEDSSREPVSSEALMSMLETILPARENDPAAVISRGYTYVRQWGGDIAVTPLETGSRTLIYLPGEGRKAAEASAEAAAAPAPAAEPEAPAAPAVQPTLETILVVEDEGGIRALVRKILRRQGYTVLEASNGDEALKVCQEHSAKIDLLITDVMMPQLGGRQLVDTLKEHCHDMKVLYVSGYTDDASIYAGDFPPGTAFLQKPFTLGSLLEKVKEVLGK